MHWAWKAGLIGLSAIGFSTCVYFFLKEDGDLPEYTPGPIYSVRSSVVEIKVPRVKVVAILGENGATIRKIEQDTDTRIFFKDCLSPDMKICVIRGGPGSVVSAQRTVYDKIINYPTEETLEIFLPIRICRALLLRHGEEIHRIERSTQTKVAIDNWCFYNNYSTRKVVIKGYPQQIEQVKSQLMQIMDEDEETTPCTPNGILPRLTQVSYPYGDEDDEEYFIPMEDVFRTGDNGLLEVYIASIESPQKFWIQIMGPGVLSVDRLADEMTEFYEKEDNKRSHKIQRIRVGQFVAVPHNSDQRYYRAEVKNILPDPDEDGDTVVEVFYVDFGDVGRCKKKEAFKLSDQFTDMRHQAIQCSLANIKEKKVWPSEAIDFFANLTSTGAWNTMSARIIKYICPSNSQSRSMPIPCLHLIDTTHSIYTDINYELVRSGYAEWVDDIHFME